MARLPQPGGDNGNWGGILNDYLAQSLDSNGTVKNNAIGPAQLQAGAVTAASLAPNSVTSSALASDSVDATAIADGTISESLLTTAVQTKLNATTVMADGSVTSAKIAADAVAKDKLTPALRAEIDQKLTQSVADSSYAPNSATMVPLKSLWCPYSSDLYPASDIVSDVYQTDVPGASIFPDGFSGILWNDSRFNTQSQQIRARNPGNVAEGCWNNPTTREYGGAVLDIEFDHEGDTLSFMVALYKYSDSMIYASDEQGVMRRVRSRPLMITDDINTFGFRTIQFASRRSRRIRFVTVGTFYQVLLKPGDVIRKSPDKPLVVSISDSYREAGGMKNISQGGVASAESYFTGAINEWYQERTGWALARLGQGGTGWFNNASGTASNGAGPDNARPFFSDENVEKIKAYGKNTIRIIDVNGTINDGELSGGKAGMKARALEGLNKIYSWDAGIRFVLWGPEPYNNPQPNDVHDLNRQALIEVANEHPAVIGFIDCGNPANPFFSGTGSEAAPDITSSQARLTGMDGIHYNYEGGRHYAALGLGIMGDFMIERSREVVA